MYIVPTIQCKLYKHIHISRDEESCPVISHSLFFYLTEIKKQISAHGETWEQYKHSTNPYKYLHHQNSPIPKIRPVSPHYFSMVELIQEFELGNQTTCRMFHFNESFGFIDAMSHNRLSLELKPAIVVIPDVPIYSLDHFAETSKKHGSSMDIVFADIHTNMFEKIIYALTIQRHGGCLLLKVADIFTQSSIDMIALCASMYKYVYIIKPTASSHMDSEKYIVCKGFLHESFYIFYSYLYSAFETYTGFCNSFFTPGKIPTLFTAKLDEINIIFGQQQIEHIQATLLLAVTEETHEIDKHKIHVQKAIQWCVKHNITYSYVE